tara:strand:- start:134 stop:565 length:432 start_codon:yes stop_codon:yes gene_type:complete
MQDPITKKHDLFFFYGSLRDVDILSAVIGKDPKSNYEGPQIITGWQAVFVAGEKYPALTKNAMATCAGETYSNFSLRDLAKIDYFEIEYHRETIEIENQTLSAWLPPASMKITTKAWNWDHFLTFEKAAFLQRTKHYMKDGRW